MSAKVSYLTMLAVQALKSLKRAACQGICEPPLIDERSELVFFEGQSSLLCHEDRHWLRLHLVGLDSSPAI